MVFTLRREESQRLQGGDCFSVLQLIFVWEDFRCPGLSSLYTSYSVLEHFPYSSFASVMFLSFVIIKRL